MQIPDLGLILRTPPSSLALAMGGSGAWRVSGMFLGSGGKVLCMIYEHPGVADFLKGPIMPKLGDIAMALLLRAPGVSVSF